MVFRAGCANCRRSSSSVRARSRRSSASPTAVRGGPIGGWRQPERERRDHRGVEIGLEAQASRPEFIRLNSCYSPRSPSSGLRTYSRRRGRAGIRPSKIAAGSAMVCCRPLAGLKDRPHERTVSANTGHSPTAWSDVLCSAWTSTPPRLARDYRALLRGPRRRLRDPFRIGRRDLRAPLELLGHDLGGEYRARM
jgi:hypothetical protein